MNHFINLYDPSKEIIEEYKELGYPIPYREELSSLNFGIIDTNLDDIKLIIPIRISDLSFNDNLNTHDYCFIVSKTKCIFISYDDFFIVSENDLLSPMSGPECYIQIMNKILFLTKSYLGNYFHVRLMYLSNKVFNYDVIKEEIDHRKMLKSLGKLSDYVDNVNQLSLKIKKSLECLEYTFDNISKENLKLISIYKADTDSINDTIEMYSTKIGFLLDSTLGFINIDQNNTMKILTIVSSVLIAPTLIAGIYGMNFSHIPGGDNYYGFDLTVSLMFIMVILPLLLFWHKGWFKLQ